MKDRVPTKIIDGAIRMEKLDENGASLGYIYLKRADAPIEAGTPYCKASILTDKTASAIGLDASLDPTPNDAFYLIANRLQALDGYASERTKALENNVLFPHVLLSNTSVYTAQNYGRYRITVVGCGGNGGAGYKTSGSVYKSGGGGGAGGVGTVTLSLNKGDTLKLTFASNAITLRNNTEGIDILKVFGGSDGTDGYGSGRGGEGGNCEDLSDGKFEVALYPGNSGSDGTSDTEAMTYEDAGSGGNVSYYFSGQSVTNDYTVSAPYLIPAKSGTGIFAEYDLGYGGAGGYYYAGSIPACNGGKAGAVIEYMGE